MTPEERAAKITDQFFDVRPIRRSHDPAVVMTEPMGVLTADIAQAIREAVAEERREITDKLYDLSEKVREQCGHSEFGQGYITAMREADDIVKQAQVEDILRNTPNE